MTAFNCSVEGEENSLTLVGFDFSKITNCGALLNTSFNLHGSPIVENLEDALKVLNNSGLDGLLTKNYIILKKKEKGFFDSVKNFFDDLKS